MRKQSEEMELSYTLILAIEHGCRPWILVDSGRKIHHCLNSIVSSVDTQCDDHGPARSMNGTKSKNPKEIQKHKQDVHGLVNATSYSNVEQIEYGLRKTWQNAAATGTSKLKFEAN